MPEDNRKWTEQQLAAINKSGSDILVAAGAGAGKTAVLVERIIRRLLDSQKPLDIDRILIVTFTKAAAAEMKQRISEAVLQELNSDPLNQHLHRQLNLLNQASIDTLHAFCLQVVRTYGYKLELDPAFRVGEDAEMKLLRQEVLEKLLEEAYEQSERTGFLQLVDHFGGERSDAGLAARVEQLYQAAVSHPWPEKWLAEAAAMYNVDDNCSFEQLPWTQVIKDQLQVELQGMADDYRRWLEHFNQDGADVPLYVAANLQPELAWLEQAAGACSQDWQTLSRILQQDCFARLQSKRGAADEDKEQIKAMRTAVKKKLSDFRVSYFSQTPENYLADLQRCYPLLLQLTELTSRLIADYRLCKQRQAVLDFSDLEHYCLQIMTTENESGDIAASPEALQLRQQFTEVYIDEYQDTNNVQESIIQLLADNNLFMVGDVKQSIYRFRLADPSLFLQKYLADDGAVHKIDLQTNFRSRQEILDAVNFVFRQIMNSRVGEIAYDKRAEIAGGAIYPPTDDLSLSGPTEVLLLDSAAAAVSGRAGAAAEQGNMRSQLSRDTNFEAGPAQESIEETANEENQDSLEYLTALELEAKVIAARIAALLQPAADGRCLQVFDKHSGGYRPLCCRDIVILLPTANKTGGIFLEQLDRANIPAYAELASGWLVSAEIMTLQSLLQIIDNPYQDIPLAAVLRSAFGDFSSTELAQIRLANRRVRLYEALQLTAGIRPPEQSSEQLSQEQSTEALQLMTEQLPPVPKVKAFLSQLDEWRSFARRERLPDLLRLLLYDSGFYDYEGGLPNGRQRQANLRMMISRAAQYQSTARRGLFGFLQYLNQLQENKRDMAAARTIGENEDVVRIMSVHKSKGLEFPVVFLADAGHGFNMRDQSSELLIHKDLGLGVEIIDPVLRVSYPGLAQQAIREQQKREVLAEEMRVLYVAMTRAREKLFISGMVCNLEQKLQQWSSALNCRSWVLPDRQRLQATCFLDWLLPALFRHREAEQLRSISGGQLTAPTAISTDPSRWQFNLLWQYPPELQSDSRAAVNESVSGKLLARVQLNQTLTVEDVQPYYQQSSIDWQTQWRQGAVQAEQLLQWHYPDTCWQQAAKVAVTEIKDLFGSSDGELQDYPRRSSAEMQLRRPLFMQKKGLSAAEYGTALHLLLRHLNLKQAATRAAIEHQLQMLCAKEILTEQQAAILKLDSVTAFVASALGRRLAAADECYRELPFSLALPLAEIKQRLQTRQTTTDLSSGTAADNMAGTETAAAAAISGRDESDAAALRETVLLQGEIDCLFREDESWILVDYKTDRVEQTAGAAAVEQIIKRYEGQLALYQLALERIMPIKIAEKYIYLFATGDTLKID